MINEVQTSEGSDVSMENLSSNTTALSLFHDSRLLRHPLERKYGYIRVSMRSFHMQNEVDEYKKILNP